MVNLPLENYEQNMNLLLLLTLILVTGYALGLLKLRDGILRAVRASRHHASGIPPTVTVVVSLHNEAGNIPHLLPALLAQQYPANRLEFILVNDRSTDNTEQLLAAWARKDNRIRYITITKTPPGIAPKKYALSQAISRANGEIILQTDADGRPSPTWVQEMVQYFTPEVGVVLGYAPYLTSPPYQSLRYRLLALEYCSIAGIALATTGWQHPATAVGTNLAYRRQVFEDVNGYGQYWHIPSGDDDLFVQEVRRRTRWRFAFAATPGSFVWNAPPTSFRQFYHQRLRFASKGFLYDFRLTAALIAFYLLNSFLLIGGIGSVLGLTPAGGWLAALLFKMAAEGMFMHTVCHHFQQRNLLNVFPLAALLHIPYVLYFGLAAQFSVYQWKGVTGQGSARYWRSNS